MRDFLYQVGRLVCEEITLIEMGRPIYVCVASFHGLGPELCTVKKFEHNRASGYTHSFLSTLDCGWDVTSYLKSYHPDFLLAQTNLEL